MNSKITRTPCGMTAATCESVKEPNGMKSSFCTIALMPQVGDGSSLTEDKDKQVERMGLTPDWIIQVTAIPSCDRIEVMAYICFARNVWVGA